MDTYTYENVKLLLSPRQSRGITYWIYHIRDGRTFEEAGQGLSF